MRSLRLLLFPFAILYDMITRVRNYLYDIGHTRSFEFTVPVISVGNLNTGGSGKTPMIEYLIRLMKHNEKIATLSRGYGRKTRGLRFASPEDNAMTIGDEPFQFYKKFQNEIHVTVGEDRAFAIPNILQEYPDTSVVLLDDAFQHRSVKPQFSILVTEYSRPFFEDFILPAGNLREARSGVGRANVIVVTKCPDHVSQKQMDDITLSVRRYGPMPVFFSQVVYGDVVQFKGDHVQSPHDVVLISGIARADDFEKYGREKFNVIKHFSFADHHRYTKEEIEEVTKFVKTHAGPLSLVTTEKDMSRLSLSAFDELLLNIPAFYLPIEMKILKNGSDFDKLVIDATKLPEEG